jgi:hypothetical protein
MHTPGCASLSDARMPEEQAERLKKRGRAGGPTTVLGARRHETGAGNGRSGLDSSIRSTTDGPSLRVDWPCAFPGYRAAHVAPSHPSGA